MHPPRALASAISAAAQEFDVPETLLLAWSWHETEWTVNSWWYEPNLDRFEVTGKAQTWASHPEWLQEGPTCDEFFTYHPDRAKERQAGLNYGFVAQTRLASGYGPFLLRYTVALVRGFTEEPEVLRSVESARWAAWVLRAGAEEAAAIGIYGDAALRAALMRVGGRVPSRSKVTVVDTAHRTLFGRGFFA